MSDPFATANMADALPNTTETGPDSKGESQTEGQGPLPSTWGGKVKFDYHLYTANTREEREALEAAGEAPTWASSAEKYEWSDEYGDIGPEHPELEKQLFGDEFLVRTGNAFEKVKEVSVLQEGTVRISPVKKFEDAGIHPIMLRNVKLCGYDVCTPVQAYCLPAIFKGYDVCVSAHTGSGKTAAFLVPILSKLMGKAKTLAAPRPNPATFDPTKDAVRAEPLVVIVTPTRELATQVFDEARRFCYRSMLRPAVVYGGVPIREQRLDLQRGCDILIGTPGRLCDFMNQSHVLSLRRVKYTVIDEADEMLASDWEEELKRIMHGGDNNPDDDHIYMMFSATFPKAARELARQFLSEDHVRISVGRPGSTHNNIKQEVIFVAESEKNRALYDLLLSLPAARTMIFVNSKRTCDSVDDYLYNLDLPSTSIHSDRTQREREDALRAFRKGRCPIMVATGLSARGIDIKDVMHIVNYDLPSTTHGGIHEYIHRIGRTARIGNTGLATSFYNEKNEDIAEMLVKTLLEAKQPVPDFLQSYIPEGFTGENAAKLDFDDESDPEGDMETTDNADAAASKAEEATDWNTNGNQADDWGTTKDAANTNGQTEDWGVQTPAAIPEEPKASPPAEDVWVTASSPPTKNTWGVGSTTNDKPTVMEDNWRAKPAPNKPTTAQNTWDVGSTTNEKPAAAENNWGSKLATNKPAAAPNWAGNTENDWGANTTNKPTVVRNDSGKDTASSNDDPWGAPAKKRPAPTSVKW